MRQNIEKRRQDGAGEAGDHEIAPSDFDLDAARDFDMRQDRQRREHALDDHADIGACVGRCHEDDGFAL